MPQKKYTHLFFDLDNTIWDFNSNSYVALRSALNKLLLLEKIGSYDTFFNIYCEVNEKLWELYRHGLMTKKVLSVQRFEESFEKHGMPEIIDGGVVNDAYLSEMPAQTLLVEGARRVLDYLHGKYEIAIITNGFKEVQYDKIRKSELTKYFRKIFISEEVGAQKPGKQIFEHAIRSMNAPKKSSLMIGDSWEADILGAMKFGIDQIYYNPKNEKKSQEDLYLQSLDHNICDISNTEPCFSQGNQKNINNNGISTIIISNLYQLTDIL